LEVQRNPNYDIVVIGGGASGAGVCLDASTRGLRTLVIEKDDFGSGTSSKSTKLIHGGVRYLQQVFAFSREPLSNRIEKLKLVTESIKERGHMIQCAPYMNSKVQFVIPTKNIFESTYFFAGLVLYYLIYQFSKGRNTAAFNFPYFLHRSEVKQIFPYISEKYSGGVVYEDGQFNDSRMLLMTLLTCTLTPAEHRSLPTSHSAANILNKAEFIDFIKNDGAIEGIVFEDKLTAKRYSIKAKYVVNCAGVWADSVRKKDNQSVRPRIRIVGGSHLTYDSQISSSKYAICLPSKDGRVLMVVPWLNKVIAGTTEKVYADPVDNPTISSE
jgi:glycerol-3-phosphate dehydrogenase